jgi:hypothetical protein
MGGEHMSRIFVSYARVNKEQVDGFLEQLESLDYDVWIDSNIKGGQEWWEEIIDQIESCDIFLAVVSRASVDSDACARERAYALALGKPILPVGVEAKVPALPRELSQRQIVDYSGAGSEAAFALIRALRDLPAAPPLPVPMPEPPSIPLSYLVEVDERSRAESLTQSEQRQLLDQLERGVKSRDADERADAQEILARLGARTDLFADVADRIDALRNELAGPVGSTDGGERRSDVSVNPPPTKPEPDLESVIPGRWSVTFTGPQGMGQLDLEILPPTFAEHPFTMTGNAPYPMVATGACAVQFGRQLAFQGTQQVTAPFPQMGPYATVLTFDVITANEIRGQSPIGEAVVLRRWPS